MSKIDVGTVEGYESMTAEEKVAALESYEIPDPDMSGTVSKDVFDKTASELAAMKKQLRENLSATEREKAERDEELSLLREQVQAMERERTIASNKARFMALGLDEVSADNSAKALSENRLDVVFNTLTKYLEARDKAIKAEILKGTPRPPAGAVEPIQMTKEEFLKLDAKSRFKFSQEHPEEYSKMYGS